MTQRSDIRSSLLIRACRIACLFALGALVAGCDKCNDWPWSRPGVSNVCHQQAPKPQ